MIRVMSFRKGVELPSKVIRDTLSEIRHEPTFSPLQVKHYTEDLAFRSGWPHPVVRWSCERRQLGDNVAVDGAAPQETEQLGIAFLIPDAYT